MSSTRWMRSLSSTTGGEGPDGELGLEKCNKNGCGGGQDDRVQILGAGTRLPVEERDFPT